MMKKEVKILRLNQEVQTKTIAKKNEMDILVTFQQELLEIDALIPNNLKHDEERSLSN